MTSLQELAERALELAGECDGCVAVADETSAAHVRWAANALTTNGLARARQLTVIWIAGASIGVASHSGALDDGSLGELVAQAKRAAHGERGGHVPPPVTGPAAADWGDPPGGTSAVVLDKFVTNLQAAMEDERSCRTRLSGFAEQQVRTTYLASSTGLRLRHEQPTAVVDLVGVGIDGCASAWAGAGAASIAGVDVRSLRAAVDLRLGWASREAGLRPGRYQVVLTPACVADLMLHLYRAATAREAMNGQGVFARSGSATRLGERVTATRLTLRSDPREAGLECAPFTVARSSGDRASVLDNGLQLTPTRWISDGVLTALVQTRETAQITGQAPTGEIDNLVLEGPNAGAGLSEMVARTERALLVTALWYLREVDRQRLLLTGVTRDGVYLVERGEVVASLPDFRFNESPVELLGRVTEVGHTERTLPREWGDYFSRMAMPWLRVEDFNVSAIST